MLKLVLSRSGYGKTHKINEELKTRCLNGEKGLVLLVPEQYSFEAEREMLQLVGASHIKDIEVLSFTRLSNKFFALYGGHRKRAIDITGKTAMMELAVKKASGEIELFCRQIKSPEFIENLLDLDNQFKRLCVSCDDLMLLSENKKGIFKKKLREISVILAEYQNLLNNEFYDPLDDLTLMAKMLSDHPYFDGKQVYLDGFSGFTNQQLLVMEKIIEKSENVTVTLCYDGTAPTAADMLFQNAASTAHTLKKIAKNNGIEIAEDEVLLSENRFKSEALEHLEANIFRSDANIFSKECDDIILCNARNIYDECDYVARTIHRLVRNGTYRWRDFAVIARRSADYSQIIGAAFAKYGVPVFVDDRVSVENMAVFRVAISAMQAVIKRYDTDSIMSMLKTGVCSISPDDIAALDIYTCIWRIDGDDWLSEWVGNPEGMSAKVTEKTEKALAHLNELRKYIVEILDIVKKGLLSKNAAGISKALFCFTEKIEAPKNLKALSQKLDDDGNLRESEMQVRSYDLFISLLDQLVMALEDDIDGDKYCELFCLSLRLMDIGSIPQGLDQVAVGSAERMRPKSPKITFVIGAVEGKFPEIRLGTGLFSDDEAQDLCGRGIEVPCYNEKIAADELYLAYIALCTPSQKLYVTRSLADLKGEAYSPSQIIEEIEHIFPNCRREIAEIEDVNDAECEQDLLALISRDSGFIGKDAACAKQYFAENDNNAYQRIASAENRDMSITADTALKLYGKDIYMSASKIDVFHKCGFYYFCKYGLKAAPVRVASLDMLQRGTLVHYVLEQMIQSYSPDDIEKLNDSGLYSLVREHTDNFIAENLSGRTLTAAERYNITSAAKMLTVLIRRIFEDLLQSSFAPCNFELNIGGENPDIDTYEINFGDGRLLITGKVDRVDSYYKGNERYLRIIDYKTGAVDFNLADCYYGQNLQMLVYMLAIIKNGKEHYGDFLPAGILYTKAKTKALSADKISEEELNNEQKKALRPAGFVLNDTDVLNAMSENSDIYLPIIRNKDGSPRAKSSCYTIEQFGVLVRHIEELLKKMGNTLHSGRITVSPLDGCGSSACKYCDYSYVCNHTDQAEKIASMSVDEVISRMSEDLEREGE